MVEAPPINGHRLMLVRDLAQLMYGMSNISNAAKLVRKYGTGFCMIRSYGTEYQKFLRTAFGLESRDGSSAFAAWQHFLIVAM